MVGAPQIRFLVRGLMWLAVTLTLWWTLLHDPLLSALRSATATALSLTSRFNPPASVSVQADGMWAWQIPLPETIGKQAAVQRMFGRESDRSAPVKVRILKETIPQLHAALFTFTFPFFWATALAAPWSRRTVVALIAGSAALGALAVLLEIVDVAYFVAGQIHLSNPVLDLVNYFATLVIPYLTPPLLALCLLRDLRRIVLAGQRDEPPVPLTPRNDARNGRGAYRRTAR